MFRQLLPAIKQRISNWLLADQIKELNNQEKFLNSRENSLDQAREKVLASLPTISDMVRYHLKGIGFNPEAIGDIVSVDQADILAEVIAEEGSDEDFLKEIKIVAESKSLKRLQRYLIRNQLLYSTTEAKTLEEINFGRATINGVQLESEELERLLAIWKERTTPSEEFDKHEVL